MGEHTEPSRLPSRWINDATRNRRAGRSSRSTEGNVLKRSNRVAFFMVICASLPLVAQGPGIKLPKGPEEFSINAQSSGDAGALASQFVISIDRYSTDKEREVLATALKQGGYPAFLPALRKAPLVGHLKAGTQTFDIRYAFQQPATTTATGGGRSIVIVTDKPVYFVGGGAAQAKPREGYEVAVAQFEVDEVGLGQGTMAMAARVKPGGPAGVQIDDYADKPVKLATVRKLLQ
jgi:hypothetical protein